MTVLLVAGPPAAGKNTVGEQLCALRERAALVDVDQIRQLVRAPYVAPWEGEEGRRQYRLGIRNACTLAKVLHEDGCDVVMVDVAPPEVLNLYDQGLQGVGMKTVLLQASPDELVRRDGERGKDVYDSGLPDGPDPWPTVIRELALRLSAASENYDFVLDTAEHSASECATALAGVFTNQARMPNGAAAG